MRRMLALVATISLLATLTLAPVTAGATTRAYLIGSKAPLTAAQVRALKDAGATIKYVYQNFGGAAGTIPSTKVAAVKALRFVTSVRVDPVRQLTSFGGVPAAAAAAPAAAQSLPGTPYWLDLIDAESNTAFDGSGVWVAVLDSGFYPNWRDYFDPASILGQYGRAFNGAGYNGNLNWQAGSDPHGMAVAATIVGYTLTDKLNEGGWGSGYATGAAGSYRVPGVAPGAKIIPIQVCIPIGCFGSAINRAVDYVTSLKKANPSQPIVINESLGGAGLDPVEKAAIDAAIKAGVVIVASAGNAGNAGMGFPGAYEPVISTGAGGWVDQWNQYPDKTWWLDGVPETGIDQVYVTGFSSRQLTGQYLDVVSSGRFMLLPYPCVNLYQDGQVVSRTNHKACASKASPDNPSAAPFQFLFMSGTSFSTPATAGIVALMLDKDPTLSNADATFGTLGDPASWGPGSLELILEGSATDLPGREVTVTHRTGVPLTECWEQAACPLEATGHGWIFVDDALAAVP